MLSGKAGKLHFGVMLFLMLHFLFFAATGFTLEPVLVFSARMIAFLTGVLLFFQLWGKRSFLKYYAGIYVLAPLLVIIGYLIDGILGAILGSFMLLFVYQPEAVVKDGAYELKTEYAGLMNPCCFYALYENKYLLFEKRIVRFRIGAPASAIQKLKVSPSKVRAFVYFTTENITSGQEMIDLPPH